MGRLFTRLSYPRHQSSLFDGPNTSSVGGWIPRKQKLHHRLCFWNRYCYKRGNFSSLVSMIFHCIKCLYRDVDENLFIFVFQSDFVTFSCPLGYAFEDSTNITHYAFCFNTTWVHAYDEEKRCLRKLIQFFKQLKSI